MIRKESVKVHLAVLRPSDIVVVVFGLGVVAKSCQTLLQILAKNCPVAVEGLEGTWVILKVLHSADG